MTIQGIKENQREQSDADFFAQHPQPTLQEARFWQQDAHLNQICLDQEQDLGLTLDEALEAQENDDALALAALNNNYDDEGNYNHNCNNVCACIRYFEDPEDQDSALYERKCVIQLDHSLQSKRQKIFDEHEPIPMDISDDEDEDLEQGQSDSEDGEESEFICRHGNNCANRVCYDCVWYLEQEARHAYSRGKEAAVQEEAPLEEEGLNDEQDDEEFDYYADMIMPTLDDVGTITDIPMDISDDEDEEQEPRAPIRYQRQTTCWVDEETGETVYNGSSDGSRYSEDDDDLPDLIDVTAQQKP